MSDDIAVAFLASDRACSLTGETFHIDSGSKL
jgi:enoyl-[acyl-carrier-protein] reductase (NADH)